MVIRNSFARSNAIARSLDPVGHLACRQTDRLLCALPIGSKMVCGDPRQREDRPADSEVITGGDRHHDVWLIRSGVLRLQHHAYNGRRQILSLFYPGEVVGFVEGFRDGVTVETATPSGLCRIDRRSFQSLVNQSAELRAELIRQKKDQLDRLHWLTWSLGALGPEERLCAFLALSSKFMPYQSLPDGTGVLSVDLPRRDIADLLGTTVETISRVVRRLADAGVIEVRDPACFRLMDLPRLTALGQIDWLLDTMAVGDAAQGRVPESPAAPNPVAMVCLCNRQSGMLTTVNEPRTRSGIHAASGNPLTEEPGNDRKRDSN